MHSLKFSALSVLLSLLLQLISCIPGSPNRSTINFQDLNVKLNDSSAPNDDPIPSDLVSEAHVISPIRILSTEVFALMISAADKLGKEDYNADMSRIEFQWPTREPRLVVKFVNKYGQTLKVHHQLWSLYACADFLRLADHAHPFYCDFGRDSQPFLVRLVVLAFSANTNNVTSTSTSVLESRPAPSYVVPASYVKRSNSTDTNMSLVDDVDNGLNLKIGEFTDRPFEPSTLIRDFLKIIIYAALYILRGDRFPSQFNVDTPSIWIYWRSMPLSAGSRAPDWSTIISVLRSIYVYMVKDEKFFECLWVAFQGGDEPILESGMRMPRRQIASEK